MNEVKGKPKRSLRAERAAATREAIAASARRLFASRGYGATTLAEVAAGANVAVQTVYAVYGSKLGILRTLQAGVVRQPEAGALFAAAIDAASGPERLDLFAASIRQRWELGWDVVAATQDAARTDPEVRDEVAGIMATRRGGIARLAERLEPELREGLSREGAAAILNALTLPEVYAELVAVHAWAPDRFERWLAASLRALLLPPGVSDEAGGASAEP